MRIIITLVPMQHEHARHQLADRLLQALREVVDVVRHAAQQVTARRTIDVTEREPVELVLDVGTERNIVRCTIAGEVYACRYCSVAEHR